MTTPQNSPDHANPEAPGEGPSAHAGSTHNDMARLHALGYAQELARRLSGFSNYAISLSIIGILAGGATSFPLALSSVGGAAIGVGWPLIVCFSLAVASTMGQLASRYPTAGGLYHWATILGGRGWGWATAWFNLAGLITVLAAINVGTYRFALAGLAPSLGIDPSTWSPEFDLKLQILFVLLITGSQAAINHAGVWLTARLTDFNGWWTLIVSAALAALLLMFAPGLNPSRLVEFQNFSGAAGGDIWPNCSNLAYLFALGLLLPAYTISGFDASAHVAEETQDATRRVPEAIVRAVMVSGVAGWALLSAVVLAAPSLEQAAAQGSGSFLWIVWSVLPAPLALAATDAVIVAQYLCGLATVTSASRMTFAFARDGGLPFSHSLKQVSHRTRTPGLAIWGVAGASVLFTVYTPVYSTITAVCTIFLYISYVLPAALGAVHGGQALAGADWNLGRWYRPLAALSVVGCLALIAIGMQPPNQRALHVVGGMALVLVIAWYTFERRRFPGPPNYAFQRVTRERRTSRFSAFTQRAKNPRLATDKAKAKAKHKNLVKDRADSLRRVWAAGASRFLRKGKGKPAPAKAPRNKKSRPSP